MRVAVGKAAADTRWWLAAASRLLNRECQKTAGDHAACFSGFLLRQERQIRSRRPDRIGCWISRPQTTHFVA
jgi:hypothetical protein